jgi:hypothetical protein
MNEHDEFQRYLEQFRPREPGVPAGAASTSGWSPQLAIGGVLMGLVLSAVYSVYFDVSRRRGRVDLVSPSAMASSVASRLTVGAMTRIVRERPEELDSVLTAISPTIFPRGQGQGTTSALGHLERE